MKNPKLVNYKLIPDGDDAYRVLEKALRFHPDLKEARIGLAWRLKENSDKDGHVVLGRCRKVSDLHREFQQFDFLMVLNREFWQEFSEEQRFALVDHELCHAAVVHDEETGEAKRDERGRLVTRIRKHDIEEFNAVVERHGCWKRDLELFALKMMEKNEQELLQFKPGRE